MVKKLILSIASLLFLTVQAQDQRFSVSVNIPGIPQGYVVSVDPNIQRAPIVSILADGSQDLMLKGTVNRPTVALLRIAPPEGSGDSGTKPTREMRFLLEPGLTQIAAAHLDSVPVDYEMTSSPLFKEHNIRIRGGRGQEQFQQWRDFIFEAELNAFRRNLAWRDADFGLVSGKPSDNKQLVARLLTESKQAQIEVDSLNGEFCQSYPDNLMTIRLLKARMRLPFCMTIAELDTMLVRTSGNYDRAGYAELKAAAADYRHLAAGTPMTDLNLQSLDGTAVKFADYVKPGEYNLVDFWASWCGPCRLAIPQVKAIASQLGGKVNVMSVSIDKNIEDWKAAVEAEKMPWPQLRCPRSSVKALGDAYAVRAIPYLMIIDPAGHVVLSSSEPAVVEKYLRANAH